MPTEVQSPSQTRSDTYHFHRRHSARRYMRRVKESLSTRVSKLVCAIFLSLLFFIGIITFILWLSLRPHRPRFFTEDFSVSGMAQAVGFQGAQVRFNVTARNSNVNIGVHYDTAQQVTVYYHDQSIGTTSLLFPFYQRPKTSIEISGALSGDTLTMSNDLWTQIQGDRANGAAIFRLEVTSTIRFKVSTWNSKSHKMHANCDVGVGPDGSMLPSYKDKRCSVYFS
ncbi:hypothetical protein NMG60_11009776 [Bertholletia excelsa]